MVMQESKLLEALHYGLIKETCGTCRSHIIRGNELYCSLVDLILHVGGDREFIELIARCHGCDAWSEKRES